MDTSRQAPAPGGEANLEKAERQDARAAASKARTPDAGKPKGKAPVPAVAGAEVAGTARVDTLADAALALGDELAPLPNGGPGVGAAQVAVAREGFELREVGSIAEAHTIGRAHAPRVPAVTKEVLPRTDRAVDPDTVPGHRYAKATGQVRRDGLTYQAGEPIKVDFRAHSELLIIGSIEDTPWSRLPETKPSRA